MNLLFLLFLPLNFPNLLPDLDINNMIGQQINSSPMEIASDSSFSNKTLKFNSGQTIYVRVTAENDGQDKHVLNLRDNNYNFLSTYSMTKSGNQFSVNFPAPNAAGIYSLEANIVSAGSVANFVQTIEVGGGGTGNSQVNVKIENKVNTGNQVLSENDQTTASPSVLSEPGSPSYSEPGSEGSDLGFFASIWSKIIGFFKGIF